MAIVYHGSTELFKEFDLSHALEGDGKVKFGFGVYVSEMYWSAAHYAHNKKRPNKKPYYVYTLEVPDKTDDNCLSLSKGVPVTKSIIQRCEKKLNIKFPKEALSEGKYFRKYLANILSGEKKTLRQMIDKTSVEGEKSASDFLLSIGVEMIEWPYIWSKPDENRNRAYFDINKIKILKIETVELDSENKYKFIPGSNKEVKL